MINVVKPLETRGYLYSEMDERSLIETRNILMDSMEALVNKQKTEKRALSGQDLNDFNNLKEQVNEIDKALQALKVNMDDFSGGGNGGGSSAGASNNGGAQQRAYTQEEQKEIRAFVNYVKTGVMQNGFSTRDLSSGA